MTENMSDDTRMGRFRISAPNSPGPPEQLNHGRFRINPQSKQTIFFFIFILFCGVRCSGIDFILFIFYFFCVKF